MSSTPSESITANGMALPSRAAQPGTQPMRKQQARCTGMIVVLVSAEGVRTKQNRLAQKLAGIVYSTKDPKMPNIALGCDAGASLDASCLNAT